jgi:hypothetical protein
MSSHEATEYEIKAVYLYNFLLFSEWPKEKTSKPKDTIVIGIIGKDPFKAAFKPVEGKKVNGKKLVIKRVGKFGESKLTNVKSSEAKLIRECDLLFISSSLSKKVPDILKLVKGKPILTVSETKDFLRLGGMINLVIKQKDSVKFEINKDAAELVGVKFRSKLLRMAIRVIEKAHGGNKNKQKQ